MIGIAILCGLIGLSALGGEGATRETFYVDASLEPEGEVLGAEFVDLNGNGELELCLAVRTPDGERELRLHTIKGQRILPAPRRTIRILRDVQAYGFADVRDDPGKEVLLLTRKGFYSLSPQIDGMRGNVKPLLQRELLFDVPDPEKLPYWEYILPRKGGDHVVVPGRGGYSIWGPGAKDTEGYTLIHDKDNASDGIVFNVDDVARGNGGETGGFQIGAGGAQVVFGGDQSIFLGEGQVFAGALLQGDRGYRAPAIADCNRDGRADLLLLDDDGLSVYLATAAGIPQEPTRIEKWPSYLEDEERDFELRLEDLDGDGDPDILAHAETDDDGLENAEHTIYILINDGQRILPEQPTQVLRFKAAHLVMEIADIDGDGRPDLAVRKFELPSTWDLVTSLDFKLYQLLYLGAKGRQPFQRKPVLKSMRSFDETSVQGAIANRDLSMDCDGDGVADMVEIDLSGRIVIRRLIHESGFFSGDSWELEEHPWKTFEASGAAQSLRVQDLNGDGLGDIVSQTPEGLTVQLSSRGRSQR